MGKHLTRIVRNRSSRGGIQPRLIILHTTEGHNRAGLSDLTGLAAFFDRTETEASAHFGVDQEGNTIRMVPDAEKAWTAGNANSYSLNIEQISFAASKKRYWIRDYHRGLKATAGIIADWSIKHGIPIKHSTHWGVCQHVHVSGPGGHTDCGPGYPEAYVLIWARILRYRKRGRKRRGRKLVRRLTKRLLGEQRRTAGRRLGT